MPTRKPRRRSPTPPQPPRPPKDDYSDVYRYTRALNAYFGELVRYMQSIVPPPTDITDIEKKLKQLDAVALKAGAHVFINSFDPTKPEERDEWLTYMTDRGSPITETKNSGTVYAQGWTLNPIGRRKRKRVGRRKRVR
jgi:hypothetical protein